MTLYKNIIVNPTLVTWCESFRVKTFLWTYLAYSEGPNQPAHSRSLSRVFAARSKCIMRICLFKYTENFTTKKNENFQIKNSDIFHISAQNTDCGYSLEQKSKGVSIFKVNTVSFENEILTQSGGGRLNWTRRTPSESAPEDKFDNEWMNQYT